MNKTIEQDIMTMAAAGPVPSRYVIARLAQKYNTSKQRISGCISFLVTSGQLSINRCYPVSTIY